MQLWGIQLQRAIAFDEEAIATDEEAIAIDEEAIATQPAISAKSQKTRVYTVMLCIWVKNQPYMQTRSAWHVVEVVRPG